MRTIPFIKPLGERMRLDIISLFPDIFSGFLTESLLAKAIQKDLLQIVLHDLRQWSRNKHHKVDDRPYGGGPGMLIQVEPVVECVESVRQMDGEQGELILMTPQGERLVQPMVEKLSEASRLIVLCGRYEGFDQRVFDILKPREISVGDFVLNGGEVAAMVLVEAVMRLLPGVLGDEASAAEDSFSMGDGMLEYPQYTRPREFRGHGVPDVLLNGNHQEIAAWREAQSQSRTKRRTV